MLGRAEVIAFVGFMGLAHATKAEEHVVIIMNDAFFPTISYVESGDTVRFVNTSIDPHVVVADNSAWAVGPLQNGQEAVLKVASGTGLGYQSAGKTSMDGSLSFDPAPMN